MRKTFLFSAIFLLVFGEANATVCKLIPTKCYTTMGTGYFYDTDEPDSWDITSNCWGKKYICAEALTTTYLDSHNVTDRVALGRKEIASATESNDFDVTVLNGDCFGSRIVKDGGAQIKVHGNYVNVWCPGVIDALNTLPGVNITISDTMDNGDITLGTQPTCTNLADAGYINIQNGKCYGKYYDLDEYRIKCDASNPTLIVLNGALSNGDNTVSDIKIKTEADARFRTMYENAKKLHKQYFND